MNYLLKTYPSRIFITQLLFSTVYSSFILIAALEHYCIVSVANVSCFEDEYE